MFRLVHRQLVRLAERLQSRRQLNRRREFASAFAATRAQKAALQVGSICSALPQHGGAGEPAHISAGRWRAFDSPSNRQAPRRNVGTEWTPREDRAALRDPTVPIAVKSLSHHALRNALSK